MSYSDYGSYNWKKEKGAWKYHPEYEDRSLVTPQSERKLEQAYGLKFDAVMQDAKNETDERYKDLPYHVRGVHHSVIGDLDGFAVVSFKGSPIALWKGVEIAGIHGFMDEPKKIDIKNNDDDCVVKVVIDNSFNYWSVAYVRNKTDEYLGICGYGLGEHFWLDEEGDTLDVLNNDEDRRQWKVHPVEHWPREKECLDRAIKLLEL